MNVEIFVRKLEAFVDLSEDDKQFVTELLRNCKSYRAGEDVIVEGDDPEDVHIVLSGLACRYKRLSDGKRQIAAFLLPGDFCDLHVFVLKEMDHAIGCIQSSTVCEIQRQEVFRLLERPAIARALVLNNLVDEAILREWVTNIGQRHATERMAHLFCEMFLRMQTVGLVRGNSFDLPITQTDLADALGLSLVHTNKSFKRLRDAELITHKGGKVTVLDMEGLRKKSGFKDNYLHLGGGEPIVQGEGTPTL